MCNYKSAFRVFIVLAFFGASAIAQIKVCPLGIYQGSVMNFSIAGNVSGTNPNIFSEIRWKDVKSTGYGINFDGKLIQKITFGIRLENLNVSSGSVTDRDYASDDRTDLFSEFYGSTAGFDRVLEIDLGYEIPINRKFIFKPSLAYFGMFQKRFLLNANGTGPDSHPSMFIPGLSSYYRTNFKGFGGGIAFRIYAINSLSVEMKLFGYWLNNRGYGNWNTRNDFDQPKSYLHQANGYLISTGINVSYQLINKVSLECGLYYRNGWVRNGIDRLMSKDGKESLTKLNELQARSYVYHFGLGYRF